MLLYIYIIKKNNSVFFFGNSVVLPCFTIENDTSNVLLTDAGVLPSTDMVVT
jgi:hypothetical protein